MIGGNFRKRLGLDFQSVERMAQRRSAGEFEPAILRRLPRRYVNVQEVEMSRKRPSRGMRGSQYHLVAAAPGRSSRGLSSWLENSRDLTG